MPPSFPVLRCLPSAFFFPSFVSPVQIQELRHGGGMCTIVR